MKTLALSFCAVALLGACGERGASSQTGEKPAADAAQVLDPATGRMHQLRVHMASIGRPLAGDARYGGALTFAGRAAPRLMLHASRLVFPHPEGGYVTAEAPPPEDFEALKAAAGL